MKRLFGVTLLLLVGAGLGIFSITVNAGTEEMNASIGMNVEQYVNDTVLTGEEAQQTEVPQETPAPEEQTYGGFRLDFIIALAVLGGLTALSMVLGRIAKKNRKRT